MVFVEKMTFYCPAVSRKQDPNQNKNKGEKLKQQQQQP